jgi:uncharacterized OB-fold protein
LSTDGEPPPGEPTAGEPTDDQVLAAFPDVVIDHDTKDLYRGWMVRELRIRRCNGCGHRHHPPRPRCPRCWSDEVYPAPVCGRGTVHLVVGLHQGPPAPGVDYSGGPHPVVTVDLDEQPGLRWTSTLIEGESAPPHIGQRVELAWVQRHGQPYPVFRPERTP